ncbi:hypothetical protein HK405_002068, partial [Cladochytrium tenue]
VLVQEIRDIKRGLWDDRLLAASSHNPPPQQPPAPLSHPDPSVPLPPPPSPLHQHPPLPASSPATLTSDADPDSQRLATTSSAAPISPRQHAVVQDQFDDPSHPSPAAHLSLDTPATIAARTEHHDPTALASRPASPPPQTATAATTPPGVPAAAAAAGEETSSESPPPQTGMDVVAADPPDPRIAASPEDLMAVDDASDIRSDTAASAVTPVLAPSDNP